MTREEYLAIIANNSDLFPPLTTEELDKHTIHITEEITIATPE